LFAAHREFLRTAGADTFLLGERKRVYLNQDPASIQRYDLDTRVAEVMSQHHIYDDDCQDLLSRLHEGNMTLQEFQLDVANLRNQFSQALERVKAVISRQGAFEEGSTVEELSAWHQEVFHSDILPGRSQEVLLKFLKDHFRWHLKFQEAGEGEEEQPEISEFYLFYLGDHTRDAIPLDLIEEIETESEHSSDEYDDEYYSYS